MAIEHVRISQQAKNQLIKLKRATGMQNWNVLCRWAFCLSLSEPSAPPVTRIIADSSVEMTWKVFGGTQKDIYMALLKERCKGDGLATDDDTLALYFRLHLHRGISYLAGNTEIRGISDLLRLLLEDGVGEP